MRLTNEIRRKILANLVADHAIAQRAKAVMKESHDIALRVIADCYPIGVANNAIYRHWLQALRSANRTQWMYSDHQYTKTATFARDDNNNAIQCSDGEFSAQFGAETHTLSIRGHWGGTLFHNDRQRKESLNIGHIVPGYADELACGLSPAVEGKGVAFYLPHATKAYPASHLLADAKKRNDEQRRTILADYAALEAQVMGVLSSFASDTKLVEAWPDVAPYVPEYVRPTGTAVALDIKTLNEICGIPK